MPSTPRALRNPVHTFLEGPASVRLAMRLIVIATGITTLAGGLLVYAFDRKDFPSIWTALWWALQTVTTVGYGDVTPKNPVGRVIGAVVLMYSVAFLSILTAAITTSFIEHARRERNVQQTADERAVIERLDQILTRLDRLDERSAPPATPDAPR